MLWHRLEYMIQFAFGTTIFLRPFYKPEVVIAQSLVCLLENLPILTFESRDIAFKDTIAQQGQETQRANRNQIGRSRGIRAMNNTWKNPDSGTLVFARKPKSPKRNQGITVLNDIKHDAWDHEPLTFLYYREHGMTPVFYEGSFVTLKTDGSTFLPGLVDWSSKFETY